MKTNYVKPLSFLFVLLIFFSCQKEEGETNQQNLTPNSDITVSARPTPSEDMITFLSSLSEAVIIGQNGNKKEYEETLIKASKDFLDMNGIMYNKATSNSEIFSKALELYSQKTNNLKN
ncbi:MAG TPA: hypothetical protein VFF21_02620 [Flavobacteriaceae bacterium]|nr:hypothetical protein [Flavobacteriaceae bacterium]